MNLAFYNGTVLQTLYVSGNRTQDLEWYAQKVAYKMGLNTTAANVARPINPQDYALTSEDMPGFEPGVFQFRNASGMDDAPLQMGWKTGFTAQYSNASLEVIQFISIYPRENISKVFNVSKLGENESLVQTPTYGEWSAAFSFVDDEGMPGMNLVFYNGTVLETLYVSSNNTSDLEWYAQRTVSKRG